jgi:hypothetical protein
MKKIKVPGNVIASMIMLVCAFVILFVACTVNSKSVVSAADNIPEWGKIVGRQEIRNQKYPMNQAEVVKIKDEETGRIVYVVVGVSSSAAIAISD